MKANTFSFLIIPNVLITILTTTKPNPIYSITKIFVSSACTLHVSKHDFLRLYCYFILDVLFLNSYTLLCCTSQLIIYFMHQSLHLLILHPHLVFPFPPPTAATTLFSISIWTALVVKLICNNKNSKQTGAHHGMASRGHSTKYTCVCMLGH